MDDLNDAPVPGSSPVLEVSRLSVNYGAVRALKDVTLVVQPAEIVAVLGANGAGKTTLLRTLSGLVKPSSGGIRYQGDDLRGTPAHKRVRKGIVHVPEGRGILGQMTVEDNLRMVLRPQAASSHADDLERVYDGFPPLAAARTSPAANLSGGQQQMLAIARAVIARPRVILLDEPTLGLAPKLVTQVMGMVSDLRADASVLLVEQNTRAALDLADRAYVMRLGSVVTTGAAEAVRSDPALLQAYLGGQAATQRTRGVTHDETRSAQ